MFYLFCKTFWYSKWLVQRTRNRGGVLVEKEIEMTRKLMIDIASSTGLNSKETLEVSRKLDDLINHYEMNQSKLRNNNKDNLL